jgi:3-isopropylmalate/(R)-2-methylmalate dehydratase small subunit
MSARNAPTGRAFVYGDRIDTDLLAPGYAMKKGPEALARHTLEAVDPDFAGSVQPGDMVLGGADFGIGSSREQAAISLKTLGVSAVLAKSFARIFYRNCLNIGLPALVFDPAGKVSAGDQLSLDLAAGRLTNLTTDKAYDVPPLPAHLLEMIEAGGLMAHLKTQLAASPAEGARAQQQGQQAQ